MEKKFDHKKTEKNKYQQWINDKIFEADINSNKEPFSIILPPPNVTGKLHLGHAWDGTLQDILIRYKKMNNYEVMWIPGMDHAGIATQAKVEEKLQKLNLSKHQIGREKFLEYAFEWKDEYANHIREQWASLGLALDYSKEKFTLDKDVNDNVNKVFVKLYEEGLIYQGYRITNWDPKLMTALSDIEVIHKEVEGKFYHFKYLIENTDEYLEVATTRPETLFGDCAIAVNPDDERYQHLIGKYVINPANKKRLEVIADEIALIDFGSGAVKISGAHDPNDFEVCNRHPHLEKIQVMNLDGTMNDKALDYEGMDRFECRKKLVDKLKEENLLIKIVDHSHNVGHSERSGVIIEPMLTKQWYIKMDKLAKRAIENQESENKINFYPERFNDTFLTWMENIQDWCISRQLWWGHQIPVWYHNETKEIYVGEQPPKNENEYTRDSDVLDTWFSSALWPFVTTIFSNENDNMNKFYPISTLVTGYDIIFFWVSRMIFQSLKFTEQKPFNDILIHGLIRAEDGKKMSKSLGNGIDPMEVIDKYGVDALRYFLTTNSSPGQDIRFSHTKMESSWNYINKIWNISRFILQNIEDIDYKEIVKNDKYNELIVKMQNLNSADKYILKRLNETITYIHTMMDKYEFTEVGSKIYTLVWDDFASWYIESAKVIIDNGTEEEVYQTKIILLKVLVDILKMLHPFIPFVTEEIYSNLNDEYLVNQKYPETIEQQTENKFEDIKEIITTLRNFKTDNDIKPSQLINLAFERIDKNYFSQMDINILNKIGKVDQISYQNELDDAVIKVLKNLTIFIDMDGLIDEEKVRNQLIEQKNKLEQELLRSSKMLNNEKFINNANPEKITEEKNKALKYLEQYLTLKDKIDFPCDFKFSGEEIEKLNKIFQ